MIAPPQPAGPGAWSLEPGADDYGVLGGLDPTLYGAHYEAQKIEAKVITLLTIPIADRSGRFAQALSTISNAGVDMKALLLSDSHDDEGILRVVVNDIGKAESALSVAGYHAQRESAVAVEIPDRIGGLASVIEVVTRAGITARCFFCSVTRLADTALALGVFEDNERAEKVLAAAGFTLPSQDVLQPGSGAEGPSLDSYLGGTFFW